MERRVALVTGGARGIGRGIGLALAERRWNVAFCYRTSLADAAATAAAIEERGGAALAVQCDIADPVAAEALVRQVEATWGRIDALVHGAGPYHRVGLLKETVEGWREMFDTNLHPVFHLTKAVVPGMKERRWGRILAFSMANADQGTAQPMVTAHYIAKQGVLTLVRSFAKVLAPHGVTVNAISPGFIASGSAPAAELAEMVKNIPMGYVGEVSDAVGVAVWLLSDEARYVTGANVHLSGGWGI